MRRSPLYLQAPIDPPDNEWLEPDPDCPVCRGKGRISIGMNDNGYTWRFCGHCLDDESYGYDHERVDKWD